MNFASFSKISNLVYFHFLWAYHGGHTLFIFGHKMFSTNSFTIEYHFYFFFCAPSYSFSKLVHIDFALHTQFFFPTHTHNFPFGFSFSYTRSQIERKYTILYIHIYIYITLRFHVTSHMTSVEKAAWTMRNVTWCEPQDQARRACRSETAAKMRRQ